MPGTVIKQECEYLFQLPAGIKFFSVTGGAIEVGKNSVGMVTGERLGIYVTDVVFKNCNNEYGCDLENFTLERVYRQSV